MSQAPANNFLVSLQPNSLYIVTQTIPNSDPDNGVAFEPNVWHWSFFFTDAAGNATQLHWSVDVVQEVVGEYFGRRPIPRIRTRTRFSIYVSFIRLLYKKHEGKDSDTLRDIEISCRTWILDAIATFVANGWMTAAPGDLGKIVTKESQEAMDRYTAMGEDRARYRPTIKDI
ncbi:hypothetical protein QCA50_014087 [Cerrena zonata]|uniref:Uncharacterized protein n=1 Tax=Cerrena zonata TaxID=2478898 RepID=A0AAW0FWZ3_9APHY